VDTRGDLSSVASIHVSLVPNGVAGLSFTYTSGDTQTLGSMEGEVSTLRLKNGEWLVKLETTVAYFKLQTCVVSVSVRLFVRFSCIKANKMDRSTQATSGY
jgi:hypothetical protein